MKPAEALVAVYDKPNAPFELNAHLGYAKSDAFPGGPDGSVFDYSLGATAAYKMLTFGVAYVNTDVKRRLGKEALGADGAVVLLSVGFFKTAVDFIAPFDFELVGMDHPSGCGLQSNLILDREGQ